MTMASGLYLLTVEKVWENTVAFDTDADTFNVMLVTDSYTPDFSAHDFFNDVTNEVSGTGYSSPGIALASVTSGVSSSAWRFDAADSAWTTSTITARGAVVYNDTIASDPLLVAVTFGANYSTTAGTFTIQWHANGILSIA